MTLNFLPVSFEDAPIRAWTVPFESPDQLKSLRQQLAHSHVVLKLHDSGQIACVPFAAGAETEGEQRTYGTSGADLFIAAHLLQAALARTMVTASHPFLLAKLPPGRIAFVSRSSRRDLMHAAAKGVAGLERLHVFPEYSLDVRRHGPLGQPGILVGLKSRFEIDLKLSDLLLRGVDVAGKYVLGITDDSPLQPFEDPARRRRLWGQVEQVDGEKLIVAGRDGRVEVSASDVWLEPTKDNFDHVMSVVAGAAYERVAGRLDRELFTLVGAEGRMTYTHKFADWLIKLGPLSIADGVRAAIGYPMGGEGTKTIVSSLSLTEPTFVFDLGGHKTNPYPSQGLERFGPYDQEGFTPKSPRIAVLAPRQFQGRVEELISSFLDGIPDSPFAKGFRRKFHLTGCEVTKVWFDGDVCDAGAYKQACRNLLAAAKRPHLAIVLTSERQRHLTGNASPYLVAKSMLMSEGVPVQGFRLEKMDRPDLAHLLNTVSVAAYAKLSGTPYVIKVVARPMAQELVIGIGSAHIRASRMSEPDRYVGITTVFTADGHYQVSNVSREAPYDEYPGELLDALRTCIEDVKARNGWQPQDTIRLVFHVFKDLKDVEAQAVKRLVEGMTREYAGVEFAFLHIIEDHDWMVYDRASSGTGSGKAAKGKGVAVRGHALPIWQEPDADHHDRTARAQGSYARCAAALVDPATPRVHVHRSGLPRRTSLPVHRHVLAPVVPESASSHRRVFGSDRGPTRSAASGARLELEHHFNHAEGEQVVPLTSPSSSDALEPYLGRQINAMRRRISESYQQGNLDGLCAQHILGYQKDLHWDLDLTTGNWLAENADRLDDAGPLAAVGYALATPGLATKQLRILTPAALGRFMKRDHLRGGGKLAFVRDTRVLLGIGLAISSLRNEVPDAAQWLASTLSDPRLEPADRFHELLQQHVLTTVSDTPAGLVDTTSLSEIPELALVHWMLGEGTARVADVVAHHHLAGQVMQSAMLCDPAELTVPHAALVMRAAGSITAASIEKALLSRNHLAAMLRRFPAAMRRWRWDNAEKIKQPICWPITSEREVQDILLLMLLPVFEDIIDEDTSPKFGHASTRADFGIPSLRVLIEVKYVYQGNSAEFRDVEQQVMIDSIAYLQRSTLYDEIVVFIYDASASVEHHELTRRTLIEVPGIADVIIVSRPGMLANRTGALVGRDRSARATARKKTPAKRTAVKSRVDPGDIASP